MTITAEVRRNRQQAAGSRKEAAYILQRVESSVPDPKHFGADPDVWRALSCQFLTYVHLTYMVLKDMFKPKQINVLILRKSY
jgi:hypothetical protein